MLNVKLPNIFVITYKHKNASTKVQTFSCFRNIDYIYIHSEDTSSPMGCQGFEVCEISIKEINILSYKCTFSYF